MYFFAISRLPAVDDVRSGGRTASLLYVIKSPAWSLVVSAGHPRQQQIIRVAAVVRSVVTDIPMEDQLVCQRDTVPRRRLHPNVASTLHKYPLTISSFLLHFLLTDLSLKQPFTKLLK